MRHQPRYYAILLTKILAAGIPAVSLAQQDELPFNMRPADARVIMTGSRNYDGEYVTSTVAKVCGEVPAELNFAGVPGFIVHFYPEDGKGPVQDISFNSKELVGGVTTSSVFFLSVNVLMPTGHTPPSYVLDTSRPNVVGKAVLAFPEDGTLELTIDGATDMGEAIHLSLKCMARE